MITIATQNDGITSPKQSPPVEPPLLYQILHARLFLVGYCMYPHQSAAILGLGIIHFILLFCCPNCQTNDRMTSPHTLQPLHSLSPIFLLPLLSISGWLLCVFIKFWPYGQLPSRLSDFQGVSLRRPEQGNQPRQAQTRRWTPCLGTLVASAPCVGGATGLPMEGEVKATGGEGSGISCWLLCVLCCCVLCWTVLLANRHVET